MCFDKRVIAGLAVAAVAVLAVNPPWFAVAFLIVAICPLSMLAMMRTRNGSSTGCAMPDRNTDVDRLRGEVAGLREELAARNSASDN